MPHTTTAAKAFTSLHQLHKYSSTFEIVLERDYVYITENDQDVLSQDVQGYVQLNLPQTLKIVPITVSLTCRVKKIYPPIPGSGILEPRQVTERLCKFHVALTDPCSVEWLSTDLQKYKWKFAFPIGRDMPETVGACHNTWVTWKLKASTKRKGITASLTPAMEARKVIRVIRSPGPDAFALNSGSSINSTWVNKVDYSFSISENLVMFGSQVNLKMHLTPLLKGLFLSKVRAELLQRTMATPDTASTIHLERNETEVLWEQSFSQSSLNDQGWQVEHDVQLPQSIGRFLQNVDTHHLKITHKLRVTATLVNPAGHNSELRASLPLKLYLSPQQTFDLNGVFRGLDETAPDPKTPSIAPPAYELHSGDRVAPPDASFTSLGSTAATPAMSGWNSPAAVLSRNSSADNLYTLIRHGPGSRSSSPPTASHSMALSERLRAVVRHTRRSTGSTAHSRQSSVSEVEHPTSGQPVTMPTATLSAPLAAMADLTKVPSYNTAVRSPPLESDIPPAYVLPGQVAASATAAHTVIPMATIDETVAGESSAELGHPWNPGQVGTTQSAEINHGETSASAGMLRSDELTPRTGAEAAQGGLSTTSDSGNNGGEGSSGQASASLRGGQSVSSDDNRRRSTSSVGRVEACHYNHQRRHTGASIESATPPTPARTRPQQGRPLSFHGAFRSHNFLTRESATDESSSSGADSPSVRSRSRPTSSMFGKRPHSIMLGFRSHSHQ